MFFNEQKIKNDEIYKDENFMIWKKRWEDRLKLNNNTHEKFLKLMKSVNPLVIPRNHVVEEVLKSANNNDLDPMINLLKILTYPYKNQKNISISSCHRLAI